MRQRVLSWILIFFFHCLDGAYATGETKVKTLIWDRHAGRFRIHLIIQQNKDPQNGFSIDSLGDYPPPLPKKFDIPANHPISKKLAALFVKGLSLKSNPPIKQSRCCSSGGIFLHVTVEDMLGRKIRTPDPIIDSSTQDLLNMIEQHLHNSTEKTIYPAGTELKSFIFNSRRSDRIGFYITRSTGFFVITSQQREVERNTFYLYPSAGKLYSSLEKFFAGSTSIEHVPGANIDESLGTLYLHPVKGNLISLLNITPTTPEDLEMFKSLLGIFSSSKNEKKPFSNITLIPGLEYKGAY